MSRRGKVIIISGVSALIILLLVFLMFLLVPVPPVIDIATARNRVSAAASEHADKYSPVEFREAKALYDSAMRSWKKENQKFLYSRNYGRVIRFAGMASSKADQAVKKSRKSMESLKNISGEKISSVKSVVKDLTEQFNEYPLTTEVRNNIARGKILLAEAEVAFNNSDYVVASGKVEESEKLLRPSYAHANENLEKYFESYPQWKRWVDKTIALSKDSGDYSIIVDKYSRKVIVYLKGVKKYEYSAELGRNWVGDKMVRGDKATPEGMYRIIKKLKSDSTKYYKALLLNYPNEEDTANFLKAKAKGYIPKSARIGGMIEIHGNGGKGTDWTEGCIALTDKEMDNIFKIAKVGTPVTIVGSIYELDKVLKR